RREDSHDRRLAGTVRAQEGEDASACDVEVDAAQHVQVFVGLLEALDLDRVGGAHFSSLRSASSIALFRRARSLSIHCLPPYAAVNSSAKATGSSPTMSRTGVPSAAARSHRSAMSLNIRMNVSP